MSNTILPTVSLGDMPVFSSQEPMLEGLASGLSGSDGLKSYLLKSFEQSLQDSLEAGQDTDQPALTWILPLSLQQTEPLVAPSFTPGWQSGKALPGSESAGGNGLPLGQGPNLSAIQIQSLGELASSYQSTGMPDEIQANLLQNVQSRIVGALDDVTTPIQQMGELQTTGAQAGQYALIGSHTDVTSTTPRGLPVLTVDVPVGQPDWGKAVGERIQWMLGKQIQEAEVKLNPPHLGPLEVRVSLQHDQANVSFLASQAPTREALEAALPRLREMFGEANLSLVNVDVGQRQGSGQQAQTGASGGYAYSDTALADDLHASSGSPPVRVGSGMVDDYA